MTSLCTPAWNPLAFRSATRPEYCRELKRNPGSTRTAPPPTASLPPALALHCRARRCLLMLLWPTPRHLLEVVEGQAGAQVLRGVERGMWATKRVNPDAVEGGADRMVSVDVLLSPEGPQRKNKFLYFNCTSHAPKQALPGSLRWLPLTYCCSHRINVPSSESNPQPPLGAATARRMGSRDPYYIVKDEVGETVRGADRPVPLPSAAALGPPADAVSVHDAYCSCAACKPSSASGRTCHA